MITKKFWHNSLKINLKYFFISFFFIIFVEINLKNNNYELSKQSNLNW